MRKSLLHTIACCCALSSASSAFAAGIPTYHESIKNHICTDCSILHSAKDVNEDFDTNDAKDLAESIGYTILSEPEKQKDHYVMLGRKGGFYSELRVTNDRKIYVDRMVDKNDPQWGSKIQR